MANERNSDDACHALPPLSGTYALVMRMSGRPDISVGKLGTLTVQPGIYVYVGSAMGPGGLAARVGRHCRHEKRLRWHIDYLRAVTQIEEVWYSVGKSRRECGWANALSSMPGVSMSMSGFGASDCDCQSHLFWFETAPSLDVFSHNLRGSSFHRLRLTNDETIGLTPAADSAGRHSPDGIPPSDTRQPAGRAPVR